MRCKLKSIALVVILAEACASRPIVPVAAPASMGVDLADIPLSQCRPALHGLFISYPAADALLTARANERRACAKLEIDLMATREALALASKRDDDEQTWAVVGKVLVGTAIVSAVVGGLLLVYAYARGNLAQHDDVVDVGALK